MSVSFGKSAEGVEAAASVGAGAGADGVSEAGAMGGASGEGGVADEGARAEGSGGSSLSGTAFPSGGGISEGEPSTGSAEEALVEICMSGVGASDVPDSIPTNSTRSVSHRLCQGVPAPNLPVGLWHNARKAGYGSRLALGSPKAPVASQPNST